MALFSGLNAFNFSELRQGQTRKYGDLYSEEKTMQTVRKKD